MNFNILNFHKDRNQKKIGGIGASFEPGRIKLSKTEEFLKNHGLWENKMHLRFFFYTNDWKKHQYRLCWLTAVVAWRRDWKHLMSIYCLLIKSFIISDRLESKLNPQSRETVTRFSQVTFPYSLQKKKKISRKVLKRY